MATISLTDIVFNSDLESATVNSIFAEIEDFLDGTSASADITITGIMTAAQFQTAADGTAPAASGSYTMGAGDDAALYWDSTDIVLDAASVLTNSPQYLTLKHTTSGTPASGIGAGIKFIVETSASNNETGALLDIITTDASAGSEDFDFVIKLMAGGSAAAEIARFQSDGKLDLASGAEYQIAGTDVLSATTLGSGVVTSSLTTVGALDSGSITSGFGSIDNGTSNITTGGILKIDVDGTAINAAGSLTLGSGPDAGIFFDGTNLVIITDGAGASGIILDSEDDTLEIKGSGVLQATFSTSGLDLASGDGYSIAATSVLNATTLGTGVLTSSLTTVGALNSGSITSGFGSIDVGASNIDGGTITADTALGGTLSTAAQPNVTSVGTLTGLTVNSATITLSQDTDFVISGGVNGMSIDGTTFSVDGTNNRVGIGTAAPATELDVSGEGRFSTGVLFGTDTSSDNTLDDYEEGSFTPTLTNSPTYVTQYGRYTKIGRMVFIHLRLSVTGLTLNSSLAVISGLPFSGEDTNDNEQRAYGMAGGAWAGYIDTATFTSARWRLSGTQLLGYRDNGSGALATLTHNHLAATFSTHVTMSYYTAT